MIEFGNWSARGGLFSKSRFDWFTRAQWKTNNCICNKKKQVDFPFLLFPPPQKKRSNNFDRRWQQRFFLFVGVIFVSQRNFFIDLEREKNKGERKWNQLTPGFLAAGFRWPIKDLTGALVSTGCVQTSKKNDQENGGMNQIVWKPKGMEGSILFVGN